VRTSRLRRWSAERRDRALEPQPTVEQAPDHEVILKLGSAIEVKTVGRLTGSAAKFGDSMVLARLAPSAALCTAQTAVFVAPTAYNWLGVYRDSAVAAKSRAEAAGPLTELRFGSIELADAAYALLVSHVLLWWWRTAGDLFHVQLSWLRDAPFPLADASPDHLERLAVAGRDCWRDALCTPVQSTNRGVSVTSFRPGEDTGWLAAADAAVAAAFDLPDELVRLAREDARRLRIAGRG